MGRSRRRHGALTYAPPGALATAAPTPVGWRESKDLRAALKCQSHGLSSGTVSMLPLSVLSGSGRTCPNVTEFAAIESMDTNGGG